MIFLDVDWAAINGLSLPDDGEVSWGSPGPAPYILGNLLIFDAELEAQASEPLAAKGLPAKESRGDSLGIQQTHTSVLI
jgi:hypothetical protein